MTRHSQYLNLCEQNFHETKHVFLQYYGNHLNDFSMAQKTNVSILFVRACTFQRREIEWSDTVCAGRSIRLSCSVVSCRVVSTSVCRVRSAGRLYRRGVSLATDMDVDTTDGESYMARSGHGVLPDFTGRLLTGRPEPVEIQ